MFVADGIGGHMALQISLCQLRCMQRKSEVLFQTCVEENLST